MPGWVCRCTPNGVDAAGSMRGTRRHGSEAVRFDVLSKKGNATEVTFPSPPDCLALALDLSLELRQIPAAANVGLLELIETNLHRLALSRRDDLT